MRCPCCGHEGKIVNECHCDPNNLPTRLPSLYTETEIALVHIIDKICNGRIAANEKLEGIKRIAFRALGSPSEGQFVSMRNDMMDHQAYADLAASGGIVDAP